MKKTMKALLLLALACCLAGCSFSVSGGFSYSDGGKYSVGSFAYEASQVDAVEINWNSGLVELKETEGASLNVTEKEEKLRPEQRMRWLLDGRTLRIQFCQSGYSGVLPDGKHLTMEIPKGIELKVNVTSGDVFLGTHTLKALEAACTSGSVNTGDLSADSMLLAATSGSITTGALRAHGAVKASCTSGSVSIENAMASSITLSATSGNLTAGPLDAQETCSVECTSGKIRLEAVKAGSLKLKSTSGGMEAGVYQCGKVNVNATSGNVILSLLHGQGAAVEFKTVSGSLNGKDAGKKESITLGDGSCPIEVDTTSGNLQIVEK